LPPSPRPPAGFLGASALPTSTTYEEGEWCEGKEVTKTVTEKSPKTVTATKEDDVVRLEDAGHVVYLLGGDDYVCGSEGADAVYGGDGDDRLYGKAGPGPSRGRCRRRLSDR